MKLSLQKTALNNVCKFHTALIDNKTVQILINNILWRFNFFKFFRCKNFRKDESNRNGIGPFCKAQIIMEGVSKVNEKVNLQLSLIENHSLPCKELTIKVNVEINEIIYTWKDFKQKCLYELNNSGEIKKSTSLDKFLHIYNSKIYNLVYERSKMLKTI